jgi:ADP-heptose:LPS heptosyltransferase
MTRTLVIQLGRLGDLIQTTPLLSELAASGDHVDVLALRPQHEVLLGCPAVANIITIPESLKPLDDAIACGFPHGKIPAEAHELLAALRMPLYDRIINASHAPLGCWLAAKIPCANPNARCGGIIRDRECLYLGAASAYRIAMLQFREQNLFNLVDLIRAAPGIAPTNAQPCLYANQSADLPFALLPGRKVALNPGASEATRCWPAENFARLADALSVAGFVPLLVGAPSDLELCEKIKSSSRGAIQNFAGRTTVPEMAALLARCDLLVSADTGAAHLSAAVGTTVLGLYGATAWFAETAPYGDNHLILQTPLNVPMSAISMDAVLACILNRLGRLAASDMRIELQRQNQSAWEASIQRAPHSTDRLCAFEHRDALGGLMYRPVHRDSFTPDELFAQNLRRAFASEFVGSNNAMQTGSVRLPTASKGILAGSATVRTMSDTPREHRDSLAAILNHMEVIADFCASSVHHREASTDIASTATTLIATMEKLRQLGREVEWRPLDPIIHNLDWQLRMLPPQPPEATFRAHAQAYASAGRVAEHERNQARQRSEKLGSGTNETQSDSMRSELNDGHE